MTLETRSAEIHDVAGNCYHGTICSAKIQVDRQNVDISALKSLARQNKQYRVELRNGTAYTAASVYATIMTEVPGLSGKVGFVTDEDVRAKLQTQADQKTLDDYKPQDKILLLDKLILDE